jgi:hypothetical protein
MLCGGKNRTIDDNLASEEKRTKPLNLALKGNKKERRILFWESHKRLTDESIIVGKLSDRNSTKHDLTDGLGR